MARHLGITCDGCRGSRRLPLSAHRFAPLRKPSFSAFARPSIMQKAVFGARDSSASNAPTSISARAPATHLRRFRAEERFSRATDLRAVVGPPSADSASCAASPTITTPPPTCTPRPAAVLPRVVICVVTHGAAQYGRNSGAGRATRGHSLRRMQVVDRRLAPPPAWHVRSSLLSALRPAPPSRAHCIRRHRE